MNLPEEIMAEHSRVQSEKIANWIGEDADRFASLMNLFLQGEARVNQRAAGILSVVAEKHNYLAIPYMEAMVKRMLEPGMHDAIKRNVVRILQHLEIPESSHAAVMNVCFDMLADPKEAIAIRCFSMTILANLAKQYPEIKPELKSIIEDSLELGASAGFRSRAAKTLKALTKQ